MEPVKYAYHVTDQSEADGQKSWSQLEKKMKIFHNGLMSLDGVALSTTFWNHDLPTMTVYPKNGEPGKFYWRLAVPLNRFINYRMFLYHEFTTKKDVNQVTLLLINPDNEEQLNLIQSAMKKGQTIKELDVQRNDYLIWDEKTKQWFSNNYDPKDSDKVWVNFIVLHDVDLDDDCKWDTVERMDDD